jgi:hypothetical protein
VIKECEKLMKSGERVMVDGNDDDDEDEDGTQFDGDGDGLYEYAEATENAQKCHCLALSGS